MPLMNQIEEPKNVEGGAFFPLLSFIPQGRKNVELGQKKISRLSGAILPLMKIFLPQPKKKSSPD